MSRVRNRPECLALLGEIPNISVVCKRLNIARATFYRWYKDNKKFRDSVILALDMGRNGINDLAESSLITLIQKKHMPAIRFWLEHNNERYRPLRPSLPELPACYHELQKGEVCRFCGYTGDQHQANPKKKRSRKQLINAFIEKQVKDKEQLRLEKMYELLSGEDPK